MIPRSFSEIAVETKQHLIDLSTAADFRLGTLRVRPSLRSLEMEDSLETLEPRVMQVLTALAEQPRRVVSRDELMRRCWHGVVVGDDALQRCISRLRKVAAKYNTFTIETLPRIGYRLVPEAPSAAPGGDPFPTYHRPRLVFARMRCRSALESDQRFASLLAEDVTAALSLNPDLRVVSRHSVSDDDPVAAGQRYDAHFVLTGDFKRWNERSEVALQLTEIASRDIVDSFVRRLNPATDMLPEDDLVFEIASRAVEAVYRDAMGKALQKETNITAWEAVIRSHSAYMRINIDSLDFAAQEARRAIAIDEQYAAAHAALANALGALFELRGALDSGLADEARVHCDKALALAPDDPIVMAWIGNTLGMITRPPEGLHLLERAVELAPAHRLAHLYLTRHHVYAGRFTEARAALDEHERVAPLFPWPYFVTLYRGVIHFGQGDLDMARHYFRRSTEQNPDYPYGWLARLLVAMLAGDNDEAREASIALKDRDGHDSLALQIARIRHSYPDAALAEALTESLQNAWSL